MAKQYSNFHKGQTNLGKNIQNGFPDTQNVDIHSEPGSLTCQKALATVNEDAKSCFIAVTYAGLAYLFSSLSGKSWKRTAEGVYSDTGHTNANGAHKGAIYYEGDSNHVYYTTDDKLGRYDLDVSWNDSYQNLEAEKNHSMFEFDLLLYICNGENLASVDETDTFSSSVLDVRTKHELVSLVNAWDDLLLLGNGGEFQPSAVYLWRYATGSSWYSSDNAPEPLFTFLDADNLRYAIANSGNIYLYTDSVLELFNAIPAFDGTTSQLTTNLRGKPLIANGNKIYSLYRASRDLSVALSCEYTANGTITSIRAVGDKLIVSHSNGVDEISSNYATATITTPLSTEATSRIKVYFQEFPEGTTIGIETKIDGGDWEEQTVATSDNEKCVYTVETLTVNRNVQARITLTPNNDGDEAVAPVIDDIIFT